MNNPSQRRCRDCQIELPSDAHANTKYCSTTCQRRAGTRRYRQRQKAETYSKPDLLERIQDDYEYLQSEHRKLLNRLAARDRKIRRLETALKRADTQLETVAADQAMRTRAVRDELAASRTEVATVKRNWSIQADAARAGETVTELRTRLATVTDKYRELAMKYKELMGAAKYAAAERKHLQGIVRQWDSMCKRLNTATGGRPRKEVDKKTLATWKQFRKLVRS